MIFQGEVKTNIEQIIKERPRMLMTIGIRKGDETEVVTLDGFGHEVEGHQIRYEVGSITKTFTGMLLAKHVLEGKCQLDDSLSKYLPGLDAGYYPPLRRLATHTAGYGALPHTRLETVKLLLTINSENGILKKNPYYGCLDEEEVIRVLRQNPRKDKEYPFSYSNLGFGVLGCIIGRLEGDGYWQAMNRFVQQDLGLSNTWLGPEKTIQGFNKHNQVCGNWHWKPSDSVAAAGALSSDVFDMLSYGQMTRQKLKPYMDLCQTQHAAGNKNWAMGLGWRLDKKEPFVWHDGNSGAFSAFVGFRKDADLSVCVLTNYAMLKTQNLGFSLLRNKN